ncbi:MAG: beta-galactosidase, partial [Pseudomonadota bacterium]
PGPVNWAPHNPAPLDGMVRLWSWEAFAHGAEVVSYFRWRQAPFAQEQMHAGLLRTDAEPAPALAEAKTVADEIARLPDVERGPSPVALVFDYESDWAWQTQPQGDFAYFSLVFSAYCALRRLGLSVDIVGPGLDGLSDYKLAVIPGLMHWSDAARANLAAAGETERVIGPRAGSKTQDFRIPDALPPDLGDLLDVKVTRVESLRADMPITVGNHGAIKLWREHLEIGARASAGPDAADGRPLFARQNGLTYLAGWPDNPLWSDILSEAAERAGLETLPLPDAVRIRDAGPYRFVFNYGAEPAAMAGLVGKGELLLGTDTLPPAGVGLVRREG